MTRLLISTSGRKILREGSVAQQVAKKLSGVIADLAIA